MPISSTENPYLAARREWTERYGDLASGKRNWQLAAGVFAALSLLLSAGLIAVSLKSQVVPYIVEVDGHGVIGKITEVKPTAISDKRLTRYLLASFVRNARQVSPDGAAMKRMLDEAYAYVRGGALQTLNDYYSSVKPFERARSEAVSVEVSSLLPVTDTSWKVHWEERVRALDGTLLGSTQWEAFLTTEESRPETEEELSKNPLGLYIVQLSWTRLL